MPTTCDNAASCATTIGRAGCNGRRTLSGPDDFGNTGRKPRCKRGSTRPSGSSSTGKSWAVPLDRSSLYLRTLRFFAHDMIANDNPTTPPPATPATNPRIQGEGNDADGFPAPGAVSGSSNLKLSTATS